MISSVADPAELHKIIAVSLKTYETDISAACACRANPVFRALNPASAQTALNKGFARDSRQPIDQTYTDHIRKYTTDPQSSSRLVDYLPASSTVPTPAKVLGDVAGAPDILPYAEDVNKYFRLLESTSPRVKVFTIGHSEEGREMIAVDRR